MRLSEIVGTTLFLRGTIYGYSDPSLTSGAAPPELQLEFTLVDVKAGRVLWASQHEHKGVDYTGLLMKGAVSNSVSLADRVVTEMIDTARFSARRDKENPTSQISQKRLPEKHSRLQGDQKGGQK